MSTSDLEFIMFLSILVAYFMDFLEILENTTPTHMIFQLQGGLVCSLYFYIDPLALYFKT